MNHKHNHALSSKCLKTISRISIIMIIGTSLVCCTINGNKGKQSIAYNDFDVKVIGDSIAIKGIKNKPQTISISFNDGLHYDKYVSSDKPFSILDVIKTREEDFYNVSYLFATNDGAVPLRLTISSALDTTVLYRMPVYESTQCVARIVQGDAANLSTVTDASNSEADITKWLFRNNLGNIGESRIRQMKAYLHEFYKSGSTEYMAIEPIPVVDKLNNHRYRISSDMQSDNYYLLGCKSDRVINSLVEKMISNQFEGAVHSLSQPLSCYVQKDVSGIVCLFLIGINKDWSYQIMPVGLVCVDSIKPGLNLLSLLEDTESTSEIEITKIASKIVFPKSLPQINGFASLDTKDWGGNGLSANVNFSVTFGGDVKSITLIRDGSLAKWIGKGTKVIDLQQKNSPYVFSYEIHVEDGDNYIPVIIEDLRGNKTEFKFNVAAELTQNDNPQIDIYNDINIW